MRLSHFQKRKALDVNMTPMIDIVFQLLIFFITCSQVTDAKRQELELAKLPGSEDQAKSELIANVDAKGNLTESGRPSSVPEFAALCLEEARISHGNDPSRLAIVIRVDHRANCRRVNELMSALGKLGNTKVRLAVQP